MLKRFLSYLLLSLCALTNLNAQESTFNNEELEWIKNHPVVEFGYEPSWEPYEIYDKGKYTGIVGEYVNRISKITGIEFKPIENITWEQSFQGLKDGTIKMVPSCAISEDRLKFLKFTDVYIKDPFIICTRREYEFVGSLNDLIGKTIVVPKGYYTYEYISKKHPKINLIEAETVKACLEKVSFGEADAFVGSLGVISYYINHKGFTNLKVSAPTNMEDVQIAMAFTEDWKILRNICNKALAQINTQERSRIRKDWISVRYEYGFNWNKAVKLILLILGVASIVITLFIIWNRTLSKQIRENNKLQHSLQNSIKEIKRQDNEKTVLLQEIHHRVKNNLQIITSMIRLQASTTDNEEVIKYLNDASERIQAIALTHEKIYKSPDLGRISSEDYLKSLANDIIRSYGKQDVIKTNVITQNLYIDLNVIVPIALILNELITNSIKHAFSSTEHPEVSIEINQTDHEIYLNYSDNGKWKESEIDSADFGTSLINIFTEQLEGTFTVDKLASGTFFKFIFTPKG